MKELKLYGESQRMGVIRFYVDCESRENSQNTQAIMELIKQDFSLHEVTFLVSSSSVLLNAVKSDYFQKILQTEVKYLNFKFQNADTEEALKVITPLINEKREISIEVPVPWRDLSSSSDALKLLFEFKKRSPIRIFLSVKASDNDYYQENAHDLFGSLENKFGNNFVVINNYNDEFKNIVSDIRYWKEFFNSFKPEDLKNVLLPLSDKKTSFVTEYRLYSGKDGIYFLPEFYKPLETSLSKLRLDPSLILDKKSELQISQLNYAVQTFNCSECGNLMSCVGKETLTLMEELDFKDCVYSEKLLNSLHLA